MPAPQSYRAGYAIEVTLASGYWRYTDLHDGCTVEGNAFTAAPIRIDGAPSYGESALSDIRVSLPNIDNGISTELRANGLLSRRVRVWELRRCSPSDPYIAHLVFDGGVEAVQAVTEDWAALSLGALLRPWATVVPQAFSPLCRYVSTTQCAYVATCNKTYAAGANNCTTNAQTAIFGGFRFLPIEGDRVEFRDSGATIASGRIRGRA